MRATSSCKLCLPRTRLTGAIDNDAVPCDYVNLIAERKARVFKHLPRQGGVPGCYPIAEFL